MAIFTMIKNYIVSFCFLKTVSKHVFIKAKALRADKSNDITHLKFNELIEVT